MQKKILVLDKLYNTITKEIQDPSGPSVMQGIFTHAIVTEILKQGARIKNQTISTRTTIKKVSSVINLIELDQIRDPVCKTWQASTRSRWGSYCESVQKSEQDRFIVC